MSRDFCRRSRIEPRLFAVAALATNLAEHDPEKWLPVFGKDQAQCWRSGVMAGPRRGKREKSDAKGARILLVEARFYDDIADALLAGAMKALVEAGAEVDRISVPGSLEIPAAIAIALDAAKKKRRPYDGVVALGCVIRGDTIHFEIVSHQSAGGLMELSIARSLPIGNGIITVDTEPQALTRARMQEQDKGGDAARAALSLVRLKHRLAGQ
jgi:6,7-dimethyl-8-ribityllumazine synthase